MSTRAVYTFIDSRNKLSVYKHSDGYPSGAMLHIMKAIPLAWPLPRFEADDFAAAFVAANKEKGGEVYLTTGPESHGDLDFRYVIRYTDKGLRVKVFKTNPDKLLFIGDLIEMSSWIKENDIT